MKRNKILQILLISFLLLLGSSTVLAGESQAAIRANIDLSSVTGFDYPTVSFSKTELGQGEHLELEICGLRPDDEIFFFINGDELFYPTAHQGDKQVLLIPFPMITLSGGYTITAEIYRQESLLLRHRQSIFVDAVDFPVQNLNLTPEMENLLETEVPEPLISKIISLRTALNFALWQGDFLLPVDGRLTTDFGAIRYELDKEKSRRHSGLDLAAPQGTPVPAANRGLIAYTGFDPFSGNTVIIDHGAGLYTAYYHLHTIKVAENTIVDKGKIIGTVGTTGYSTGPHLHFTAVLHGELINPYSLMPSSAKRAE